MKPPVDPIGAVMAPPSTAFPGRSLPLAASVVPHPHLRIAHDQAMEVLTSPADHPFVVVVGPGGVGKSALVRTIDNALHFEACDEMAADPALRPAIAVETPASWTGRFDFVALWQRVIEAVDAPAIDRTTGDSVVSLGIRAAVNGHRGDRPKDMYHAAVRACRDRGVRTILLDEANHLSVLAGSTRAPEQLDVLKDFASVAGVRILLVGAFPVLAFRDVSFQVARRIRTVPFLGYDASIEREREGFRSVADKMLSLVTGTTPDLDDALLAQLMEGSAGCVGTLRNWLVAAEHHLARTGANRDFAAALRRTAYPDSTMAQARAEIAFGKTLLAGEPGARAARPYVPPRTSSGQVLKPGEPRPTRRDMADVRDA
jgi:hypothetical protein